MDTSASLFVPPVPPVPPHSPRWYAMPLALRRNPLLLWPAAAYEQAVLVQSLFGRRRLLLNDPEAIHQVLVQGQESFHRGTPGVRILRPLLGEGLLLSEGEAWRHQRRTIAPALTPRAIATVLVPHVLRTARAWVARLAAQAGGPVDLLAEMRGLALGVAARSMFSLEMEAHGTALRRLLEEFGTRLARPSLLDMLVPVDFPTLRGLARLEFRRRWLRVIDTIVAARLDLSHGGAPGAPRDLFDLLLAARDPETGAGFPREQLRDHLATLLVAGHETTSLALFWSLFLLASVPDMQERAAAEAIRAEPEAGAAALPALPLVRAVVDEALRLYPPAFAIVRQAAEPVRLAGVAVPRGTLVVIAPWVLHRHRRLWSQPEAFDPARFLPGAPPPARFAYLPFGAGPRVCVGAQFALTEAVLVLAMLLRHFRVERADAIPVLPVGKVTTQPDHPPRFRLLSRGPLPTRHRAD